MIIDEPISGVRYRTTTSPSRAWKTRCLSLPTRWPVILSEEQPGFGRRRNHYHHLLDIKHMAESSSRTVRRYNANFTCVGKRITKTRGQRRQTMTIEHLTQTDSDSGRDVRASSVTSHIHTTTQTTDAALSLPRQQLQRQQVGHAVSAASDEHQQR